MTFKLGQRVMLPFDDGVEGVIETISSLNGYTIRTDDGALLTRKRDRIVPADPVERNAFMIAGLKPLITQARHIEEVMSALAARTGKPEHQQAAAQAVRVITELDASMNELLAQEVQS